MSDLETRAGGEPAPWPTAAVDAPGADDASAPADADGRTGPASDGSDWGYGAYMSRWGDDGEEPTTRSSWIRLALLVGGIVGLGVLFGVSLVAVILALVVSIALHELGHYLAAKWSGMKVTEYFIGFGPRIWSFRKGETEYGVKAIPAGAYVRIVGMNNLDRVDPDDEGRTYRAQSYPKRLVTILAGPMMNILLGFVLFFTVFVAFGAPDSTSWTVDNVAPGSAAAAAGVQTGDKVVSVGGTEITDFTSFSTAVDDLAGQSTDIVVVRDGQTVTLPATLGWRLDAAGAAPLPGLSPRDRILEVNGQPAGSYDDLARTLATSTGPVDLEFEHRNYLFSTTVQAPIQLPADGDSGFFGIGRSELERSRLSPVTALGESARTFGAMTAGTVTGLGRLFSPSGINSYANQVVDAAGSDGSTEAVRIGDATVTPIGPAPGAKSSAVPTSPSEDRPVSIVGIVRLGNDAAGIGWAELLFLLGAVNFALGFFNLIPLLPLDGGHAAVATYEAVRSRKGRAYRVDMAKLMPVTYVAVALLLVFGLSAIFLDIRNPISLSP